MAINKTTFLMLTLALLATPSLAQTATTNYRWPCPPIPGRFAFAFQGFADLGTPTGLTPNAGGGFIQLNSGGTFLAQISTSTGGLVVAKSLTGTYDMHIDTRIRPASCAGTATATDGTTLQLLASTGGGFVVQMQTNPGLVVATQSIAMVTEVCGDQILSGDYLYSANGFFAPPDYPKPFGQYNPFAFSGVIKFDGRGHLKGWDTVSLAGNIVPRTYSGTYSVQSDCTGTMELMDTLGNDIHTVNFVHRGGRGLTVVNTDPGTVLAFTAKHQ